MRKIRFANLEGRIVAFGRVVDIEVRLNAARLNGASGGRVVACGRELHGNRLIAEGHRQNRLHRSLAEGAVAENRRALVILEGARNDF